MDIARGRHSARLDPAQHAGLVVFLLGARINRWSRPQDWVPVIKAMPPMLRELDEHPEYGLLRKDAYFTGRRILSVQYWRDFESLTRWARASDNEHLPGWRMFNQLARRTDAVGVYHETYLVGAGRLRGRVRRHAAVRARRGDRARPGRSARGVRRPPDGHHRARRRGHRGVPAAELTGTAGAAGRS